MCAQDRSFASAWWASRPPEAAPGSGLRAPGGPESRRTRIGPLGRGGKPRRRPDPSRRPDPLGTGPVTLVGHRDQAQPLGRRRIGHPVAGGRPQALHQAGRVLPAPAHLDQAGHQRAHHLVAERAGRDLEAQQPALARCRPPASSPRAPRRRSSGPVVTRRTIGSAASVPGRAAAEGAEVVAAEQHVGGGAHGAQVERVAHVPGQRGQQRVGRRGVPDQVAVGAAGGRAAGVEVAGRPARPGAPRPRGPAGG